MDTDGKFWAGLLTGVGIMLLFNFFSIIQHVTRMKSLFLDLGSDLPPLTKAVTNPLVYIASPVVIAAAVLVLNLTMRRSQRHLLIWLTVVMILGCVILALINIGIYSPLFRIIENVG